MMKTFALQAEMRVQRYDAIITASASLVREKAKSSLGSRSTQGERPGTRCPRWVSTGSGKIQSICRVAGGHAASVHPLGSDC